MVALIRPNRFDALPQEMNLKIFSFLGKRDLLSVSATNQKINALTKDDFLWQALTEKDFGVVGLSAKTAGVSWQQTYKILERGKQSRIEAAGKIAALEVRNKKRDDLDNKVSNFASQLFGFAAPAQNTHLYPAGTGFLGGRKITVYKRA